MSWGRNPYWGGYRQHQLPNPRATVDQLNQNPYVRVPSLSYHQVQPHYRSEPYPPHSYHWQENEPYDRGRYQNEVRFEPNERERLMTEVRLEDDELYGRETGRFLNEVSHDSFYANLQCIEQRVTVRPESPEPIRPRDRGRGRSRGRARGRWCGRDRLYLDDVWTPPEDEEAEHNQNSLQKAETRGSGGRGRDYRRKPPPNKSNNNKPASSKQDKTDVKAKNSTSDKASGSTDVSLSKATLEVDLRSHNESSGRLKENTSHNSTQILSGKECTKKSNETNTPENENSSVCNMHEKPSSKCNDVIPDIVEIETQTRDLDDAKRIEVAQSQTSENKKKKCGNKENEDFKDENGNTSEICPKITKQDESDELEKKKIGDSVPATNKTESEECGKNPAGFGVTTASPVNQSYIEDEFKTELIQEVPELIKESPSEENTRCGETKTKPSTKLPEDKNSAATKTEVETTACTESVGDDADRTTSSEKIQIFPGEKQLHQEESIQNTEVGQLIGDSSSAETETKNEPAADTKRATSDAEQCLSNELSKAKLIQEESSKENTGFSKIRLTKKEIQIKLIRTDYGLAAPKRDVDSVKNNTISCDSNAIEIDLSDDETDSLFIENADDLCPPVSTDLRTQQAVKVVESASETEGLHVIDEVIEIFDSPETSQDPPTLQDVIEIVESNRKNVERNDPTEISSDEESYFSDLHTVDEDETEKSEDIKTRKKNIARTKIEGKFFILNPFAVDRTKNTTVEGKNTTCSDSKKIVLDRELQPIDNSVVPNENARSEIPESKNSLGELPQILESHSSIPSENHHSAACSEKVDETQSKTLPPVDIKNPSIKLKLIEELVKVGKEYISTTHQTENSLETDKTKKSSRFDPSKLLISQSLPGPSRGFDVAKSDSKKDEKIERPFSSNKDKHVSKRVSTDTTRMNQTVREKRFERRNDEYKFKDSRKSRKHHWHKKSYHQGRSSINKNPKGTDREKRTANGSGQSNHRSNKRADKYKSSDSHKNPRNSDDKITSSKSFKQTEEKKKLDKAHVAHRSKIASEDSMIPFLNGEATNAEEEKPVSFLDLIDTNSSYLKPAKEIARKITHHSDIYSSSESIDCSHNMEGINLQNPEPTNNVLTGAIIDTQASSIGSEIGKDNLSIIDMDWDSLSDNQNISRNQQGNTSSRKDTFEQSSEDLLKEIDDFIGDSNCNKKIDSDERIDISGLIKKARDLKKAASRSPQNPESSLSKVSDALSKCDSDKLEDRDSMAKEAEVFGQESEKQLPAQKIDYRSKSVPTCSENECHELKKSNSLSGINSIVKLDSSFLEAILDTFSPDQVPIVEMENSSVSTKSAGSCSEPAIDDNTSKAMNSSKDIAKPATNKNTDDMQIKSSSKRTEIIMGTSQNSLDSGLKSSKNENESKRSETAIESSSKQLVKNQKTDIKNDSQKKSKSHLQGTSSSESKVPAQLSSKRKSSLSTGLSVMPVTSQNSLDSSSKSAKNEAESKRSEKAIESSSKQLVKNQKTDIKNDSQKRPKTHLQGTSSSQSKVSAQLSSEQKTSSSTGLSRQPSESQRTKNSIKSHERRPDTGRGGPSAIKNEEKIKERIERFNEKTQSTVSQSTTSESKISNTETEKHYSNISKGSKEVIQEKHANTSKSMMNSSSCETDFKIMEQESTSRDAKLKSKDYRNELLDLLASPESKTPHEAKKHDCKNDMSKPEIKDSLYDEFGSKKRCRRIYSSSDEEEEIEKTKPSLNQRVASTSRQDQCRSNNAGSSSIVKKRYMRIDSSSDEEEKSKPTQSIKDKEIMNAKGNAKPRKDDDSLKSEGKRDKNNTSTSRNDHCQNENTKDVEKIDGSIGKDENSGVAESNEHKKIFDITSRTGELRNIVECETTQVNVVNEQEKISKSSGSSKTSQRKEISGPSSTSHKSLKTGENTIPPKPGNKNQDAIIRNKPTENEKNKFKRQDSNRKQPQSKDKTKVSILDSIISDMDKDIIHSISNQDSSKKTQAGPSSQNSSKPKPNENIIDPRRDRQKYPSHKFSGFDPMSFQWANDSGSGPSNQRRLSSERHSLDIASPEYHHPRINDDNRTSRRDSVDNTGRGSEGSSRDPRRRPSINERLIPRRPSVESSAVTSLQNRDRRFSSEVNSSSVQSAEDSNSQSMDNKKESEYSVRKSLDSSRKDPRRRPSTEQVIRPNTDSSTNLSYHRRRGSVETHSSDSSTRSPKDPFAHPQPSTSYDQTSRSNDRPTRLSVDTMSSDSEGDGIVTRAEYLTKNPNKSREVKLSFEPNIRKRRPFQKKSSRNAEDVNKREKAERMREKLIHIFGADPEPEGSDNRNIPSSSVETSSAEKLADIQSPSLNDVSQPPHREGNLIGNFKPIDNSTTHLLATSSNQTLNSAQKNQPGISKPTTKKQEDVRNEHKKIPSEKPASGKSKIAQEVDSMEKQKISSRENEKIRKHKSTQEGTKYDKICTDKSNSGKDNSDVPNSTVRNGQDTLSKINIDIVTKDTAKGKYPSNANIEDNLNPVVQPQVERRKSTTEPIKLTFRKVSDPASNNQQGPIKSSSKNSDTASSSEKQTDTNSNKVKDTEPIKIVLKKVSDNTPSVCAEKRSEMAAPSGSSLASESRNDLKLKLVKVNHEGKSIKQKDISKSTKKGVGEKREPIPKLTLRRVSEDQGKRKVIDDSETDNREAKKTKPDNFCSNKERPSTSKDSDINSRRKLLGNDNFSNVPFYTTYAYKGSPENYETAQETTVTENPYVSTTDVSVSNPPIPCESVTSYIDDDVIEIIVAPPLIDLTGESDRIAESPLAEGNLGTEQNINSIMRDMNDDSKPLVSEQLACLYGVDISHGGDVQAVSALVPVFSRNRAALDVPKAETPNPPPETENPDISRCELSSQNEVPEPPKEEACDAAVEITAMDINPSQSQDQSSLSSFCTNEILKNGDQQTSSAAENQLLDEVTNEANSIEISLINSEETVVQNINLPEADIHPRDELAECSKTSSVKEIDSHNQIEPNRITSPTKSGCQSTKSRELGSQKSLEDELQEVVSNINRLNSVTNERSSDSSVTKATQQSLNPASDKLPVGDISPNVDLPVLSNEELQKELSQNGTSCDVRALEQQENLPVPINEPQQAEINPSSNQTKCRVQTSEQQDSSLANPPVPKSQPSRDEVVINNSDPEKSCSVTQQSRQSPALIRLRSVESINALMPSISFEVPSCSNTEPNSISSNTVMESTPDEIQEEVSLIEFLKEVNLSTADYRQLLEIFAKQVRALHVLRSVQCASIEWYRKESRTEGEWNEEIELCLQKIKDKVAKTAKDLFAELAKMNLKNVVDQRKFSSFAKMFANALVLKLNTMNINVSLILNYVFVLMHPFRNEIKAIQLLNSIYISIRHSWVQQQETLSANPEGHRFSNATLGQEYPWNDAEPSFRQTAAESQQAQAVRPQTTSVPVNSLNQYSTQQDQIDVSRNQSTAQEQALLVRQQTTSVPVSSHNQYNNQQNRIDVGRTQPAAQEQALLVPQQTTSVAVISLNQYNTQQNQANLGHIQLVGRPQNSRNTIQNPVNFNHPPSRSSGPPNVALIPPNLWPAQQTSLATTLQISNNLHALNQHLIGQNINSNNSQIGFPNQAAIPLQRVSHHDTRAYNHNYQQHPVVTQNINGAQLSFIPQTGMTQFQPPPASIQQPRMVQPGFRSGVPTLTDGDCRCCPPNQEVRTQNISNTHVPPIHQTGATQAKPHALHQETGSQNTQRAIPNPLPRGQQENYQITPSIHSTEKTVSQNIRSDQYNNGSIVYPNQTSIDNNRTNIAPSNTFPQIRSPGTFENTAIYQPLPALSFQEEYQNSIVAIRPNITNQMQPNLHRQNHNIQTHPRPSIRNPSMQNTQVRPVNIAPRNQMQAPVNATHTASKFVAPSAPARRLRQLAPKNRIATPRYRPEDNYTLNSGPHIENLGNTPRYQANFDNSSNRNHLYASNMSSKKPPSYEDSTCNRPENSDSRRRSESLLSELLPSDNTNPLFGGPETIASPTDIKVTSKETTNIQINAPSTESQKVTSHASSMVTPVSMSANSTVSTRPRKRPPPPAYPSQNEQVKRRMSIEEVPSNTNQDILQPTTSKVIPKQKSPPVQSSPSKNPILNAMLSSGIPIQPVVDKPPSKKTCETNQQAVSSQHVPPSTIGSSSRPETSPSPRALAATRATSQQGGSLLSAILNRKVTYTHQSGGVVVARPSTSHGAAISSQSETPVQNLQKIGQVTVSKVASNPIREPPKPIIRIKAANDKGSLGKRSNESKPQSIIPFKKSKVIPQIFDGDLIDLVDSSSDSETEVEKEKSNVPVHNTNTATNISEIHQTPVTAVGRNAAYDEEEILAINETNDFEIEDPSEMSNRKDDQALLGKPNKSLAPCLTIDSSLLRILPVDQIQNRQEVENSEQPTSKSLEVLVENPVDNIVVVPSPADSGFASPPQEGETSKVFVEDQIVCLCGRAAQYNCVCATAWYCGQECQLEDWESHKDRCSYEPGDEDEESDNE